MLGCSHFDWVKRDRDRESKCMHVCGTVLLMLCGVLRSMWCAVDVCYGVCVCVCVCRECRSMVRCMSWFNLLCVVMRSVWCGMG